MTVTLTPLGRSPLSLATLSEPSYTLSEQGGFKDATIIAPLADHANMRLATCNIDNRHIGHVRSAIGQTLSVQGWQTRLDDIKHGRVYITHALDAWEDKAEASATRTIDCGATEAETLVWTWQEGTAYKANAYTGKVFRIPETQTVTVSFSWAWVGPIANYEVIVYGSGGVITTLTAASGSASLTVPSTSYVAIHARSTTARTMVTDATLTIVNLTVKHANGAGFAAVINDICDLAGALVPLRDIDASITHTFDEIVFPASTSILGMLAEVLQHGDWRAYFEPRLDAGVMKPCLVVAPRPTVPAYQLTEGSGIGSEVVADIDPLTCDPLASVLRCMYVTSWGVECYVDVADTDTSHYLVDKGVTKVVAIDTGQTTEAAAIAIGRRWLVDGGRDQYSGTLVLEGAPNGRMAADYLPGELITLVTTDHGTITTRITEGTYTGRALATLTLDNAPDFAARIERWGESHWKASKKPKAHLTDGRAITAARLRAAKAAAAKAKKVATAKRKRLAAAKKRKAHR